MKWQISPAYSYTQLSDRRNKDVLGIIHEECSIKRERGIRTKYI